MSEYKWKTINYKLMTGKWKIAIILEAGYCLCKQLGTVCPFIKITDKIFFENILLPYPESQTLGDEEIDFFCHGIRILAQQIEEKNNDSECIIIAIRRIYFSDADIQNEAFIAAAIQWCCETFQLSLPAYSTRFDAGRGRNGMYIFEKFEE